MKQIPVCYLEKMRMGQMTDIEVAKITNTSIKVVRKKFLRTFSTKKREKEIDLSLGNILRKGDTISSAITFIRQFFD